MALTSVKYLGQSDVRVMSKKDLADAGVSVDGQLRWERKNRWEVFVEDPSDRLLEILKEEGTFTVSDVDEETGKKVKEIVKGAPLDDTGQRVVDATKGQTAPTGNTGRGSSTSGTV
jgi:hypothetical protein